MSYLAASGGHSKGVHHVSGSGWWRLSAFMDSGSAECVAPEDIAKSVPVWRLRHLVKDRLTTPQMEASSRCTQRLATSIARGSRSPM